MSSTPMYGLMQNHSLLISGLLQHAAQYHGSREIVSVLNDGGKMTIHRTNYKQVHERAKKMANSFLKDLGIKQGDVVATMAFNSYRHFELYYAVSGIGAILHTVNPRLFLEQLDYIINHGQCKILCVDLPCVPILLQLLHRGVITVRRFIIMSDVDHQPVNPELKGANTFNYEALIEKQSAHYTWPTFDENIASSLCYTSGTTGNPKGVLYSHRSTLLHTFAICGSDTLGVCSNDSILSIVPMFHANAWGIPYAAAMCGAKLVFPGVALDGKSVCSLLDNEKVTFCFGVPTVFLSLFDYMDKNNIVKFTHLNRVTIGGAAPPRAMIERFYLKMGVRVVQGWGMTETSPLGTTTGLTLPQHANLSEKEKVDIMCKAGRIMYGVSLKVVGDDGEELPRDGKASGDLLIAGPWVTNGYYRLGEPNTEKGANAGWFKTGDVATLDENGFMMITDRSKDVIKSGGEWISSIDLENEVMAHQAVAEAAVIGVAHPKWTERPLLIVVKKSNAEVTEKELLDFLAQRVAKWWVPEGVEFVNEIPHTATGKIKKLSLREQFKNYQWKNQINLALPSKL